MPNKFGKISKPAAPNIGLLTKKQHKPLFSVKDVDYHRSDEYGPSSRQSTLVQYEGGDNTLKVDKEAQEEDED